MFKHSPPSFPQLPSEPFVSPPIPTAGRLDCLYPAARQAPSILWLRVRNYSVSAQRLDEVVQLQILFYFYFGTSGAGVAFPTGKNLQIQTPFWTAWFGLRSGPKPNPNPF